jgi:hypothetical protein
MSRTIGVIDEPVAPGATDNLDITIHSRSLIKFIQQTNTPITVGIQGEWGSGKTSLINSIYHEFSSDPVIKQIWINSWEYSLLSTPEEALLKIINRIIEELLESDTNTQRKEAIKSGATKLFKGALRVGAQVALGAEAAKVTEELLGTDEAGIAALRKQLTNLVGDIAKRESNSVEKIVIYVDDLDRIEPKNAVAILELLKNIFSVRNCVFILAIDYQVVVKGLEHKFGKQTPENEWEFRAFFDKIIQLPFMMPMGQYNIGKYVNTLLVDIGFVVEDLDADAISEIILRTIGGNPRSIKRLVNSVSLIEIFSEEKSGDAQATDKGDAAQDGTDDTELDPNVEKFLLFSLLCLQIAYPPIYSLLVQEPDFTKWDDKLALQETKRSEEDKDGIFEREYANAQQTDDFDEDWEMALYRICYRRPRMKARVADISKFFSYIKDDLLSAHQEIIGGAIASVLSQTSVTSVTSSDQGQTMIERAGKGQRRELENFETWLVDKYQTLGSSEEELKLVNALHETIKEEFPNATEKCHGDWSVYLNGHVFFSFRYAGKRFDKKGSGLGLTLHYRTDYRVPNIQGVECGRGPFQRGKYSSVRYHQGCGLQIPTFEVYENNKDSIMEAIRASADMMTDENWRKRLKIAYTAEKASFKTFDSNAHDTDDRSRVEELCEEYLSPDYKQS